METMYYTFTAHEIVAEGAAVQQACGGARQLVCVRKDARSAPDAAGKVIDFTAWKTDREEKARLEELWYEDVCEEAFDPDYEDVEPVVVSEPRSRRNHKSLLNLDVWAGVAVLGVAVILMVRVLGAF